MMKYRTVTQHIITYPPNVSHFKSLINELKEKVDPENAMKYYIESISSKAESYPEEYKIRSNVSFIIKNLEPFVDSYLKDREKTILLFNFLSVALKFFKSSKETTKAFFSITMKTAELDDPEVLQYSSQFLQILLSNEIVYSYMFTQSRLAEVFQNCFCFYPNTRLFYGPLILSETSNRVFTKITNLTEFMEKVKNLLHDGNIEPKSSSLALTFVGYIIRSLDTGNFLPEILPYVVELAPLCENLSFFQFFLQAPTSQPNAVWHSLKEITNDPNISSELMNTILLSIGHSQKVPMSSYDFSFRPFIPIFDKLTEDQQKLLFRVLVSCNEDVVSDFIVGTVPVSTTKFSCEFLLHLISSVHFNSSLPDLWNNFILKQPIDEFINDDSTLKISEAILKKLNDKYLPDIQIFELFLKVAISKLSDVVLSILDIFLTNLKAKSFMFLIIELLKKDLPDKLLVFLREYVSVDRFASTFFEEGGEKTFENLMKKPSGRDLIARIAYVRPNRQINKFFYNNPPNDLPENEISLLMHGLPHDSQDLNQGYLCIPSLVPLVSSYKLKTPLENYIFGSAVGKFFSPLKSHFKRLISTYISSTILRYQITDPEFLPYITDPKYPHFNVLQSTPFYTKKPSKFRRPVTFGFWFNVFELKGKPTLVVNINDRSITLDEDGYLHIGNESIFCPPHEWHSVVIITNTNGIVTFYIDKRQIISYKTNMSETPFFSFGNSGINSMIYFISPYLKSSTTPISPEQVEQFHLNGPNSPTNVLIQPTNGLHYVVSDGLPKFLSTVGGAFFVFDVAMMTNTLQQFINCLEAAFNLLELGFFEKESFISSLRFILRQKDRYEDAVIQLLRDRMMNYFEIHDVCLLLNDLFLLSTKAESLIKLAPLDMTSSTCNSHFFYVIEEFCFFELEEDIQYNLLDVLKYFIEFDDSYLKIILVYVFSLPNLDINKIASIDDERQYQKQLKLINLFFDCLNAIPTTITNEDIVSSMTLLNPTIGSEFFYLYCKRFVKNNLFSDYKILKKRYAFLITIAKYEKTWVSLLSLLTDQFQYSTFEELYRNKNKLSIAHDEFIHIIFKLIANSFLRTHYAYESLQFIVDLIHSNNISLHSYAKSIQILSSLGFCNSDMNNSNSFGFESLEKSVPTSKSMATTTSMNILHSSPSAEKKEPLFSKLFNDNQSSKKKSPIKETNSIKTQKHRNSSFQAEASIDDISYEEYFDPNLLSNITNYIKSRRVYEDDVIVPSLDIPSVNELSNFEFENNKTINLIIDIIIEILMGYIDNSQKFIMYLIHLTLLSKDVDPEIVAKFHQLAILTLLKENELIENKTTFNAFLSFLSFRIYEGWWNTIINNNEKDDSESDEDNKEQFQLVRLFNSILPFLNETLTNSQDFIFSVFISANNFKGDKSDELKSTLKESFQNSSFYTAFKKNPDVFVTYLTINGETEENSKRRYLIDLFETQAQKNISWVNKKRNEYPSLNTLYVDRQKHYKRQIVISTNFKKITRYQFFWHLNLSAMYLDKAISNIHLQRLKHRFTYGIPAKFLVSFSSSPLCVPRKLLPMIFSYDNRCQKMDKLIDIPRSYHTPYLKSILPELNKVFSAPYCFAGWRLPSFVNVHFMEFAKEAFNGLPMYNPFEAQLLGTPEQCQCVVVLSEKSISFILNCNLQGQTPSTENLCHYPLYEETMAGYFGIPSVFFGKPAFTIPFSHITMVFPRRYIHSPIGLEFYTITGTQISLVVSLTYRNLLINYLRPKYTKKAKTGPLYAKQLLMRPINEIAKKWSSGSISSFLYLLYLNYCANRSFTDFSQYPVFPWVASDYETDEFPPAMRDLSKPLGQLAASRREKFERVFIETNHQYFYGTHYSNPAGVLHFMMRAEPFTIFNVVLHTGFDHRDRLFSSLAETWRTCSERNTSDLKELIPQFFCFPSMFENINKLQLQTRSDGTDINSVKLPPWGPTPVSFVKRHRQILESNLLSKTLPLWIDLIFGFKQRGQPAVEAKNLFLPISYDALGAKNNFYTPNISPTNLKNENDDENETDFGSSSSFVNFPAFNSNGSDDGVALDDTEIDTILNFGQCPLQLLTTPHIQKTIQKYPNVENSITRHSYLHKTQDSEKDSMLISDNSFGNSSMQLKHSKLSSFTGNENKSSLKRFIMNDVGYDVNIKLSSSDDDEEEEEEGEMNKSSINIPIHSHVSKTLLRNHNEPASIKWKVVHNPFNRSIRYTQGLNWIVGEKSILSVSERRIHFHSQRINSDTLIKIVDAVLSRDQTLLTIITSFGKIDTYSLLYNQLEPLSTSFLPDIIPLIAVDVSSQFSMIVIASESYLAVVDLGSGFLLSKLRKSFDKVAFDELHEYILASSSSTNEISIFSLNLHLICKAKYSSKNTLNFATSDFRNSSGIPLPKSSSNLSSTSTHSKLFDDDEITVIATTDSNHWDSTPYFITGHRNGAVNVWHVDTTPSEKALNLVNSESSPIKNLSTDKNSIMTCRNLYVADNTIDSIVVFNRGRALAYIDRNGNAGVISVCMKNRKNKKLLKNRCFEFCSCCGHSFMKESTSINTNTMIFSGGQFGISSLPKLESSQSGIGSNPNSTKSKQKANNDDIDICVICGLPCCKKCILQGSLCVKCQDIITKCNGNFIIDNFDDNDF